MDEINKGNYRYNDFYSNCKEHEIFIEHFSGFGENEFTDEEIEQYKEDFKNMANDFLKYNNNENTDYSWEKEIYIPDEYRAFYQHDKVWEKAIQKAR